MRAGSELNSTQHYVWVGRWPSDAAGRADVLVELERQHIRSVCRFSLGVVRTRRRNGRIEYALPGGALALAFVDSGALVEERRVERRWRIVGGLLARPLSDTAVEPSLSVGVERMVDGRNHAWVRVTGFRSRLLAPLPSAVRGASPLWGAVGCLYRAYHAQAAYSCLRGLAATPALGGRA